MDSFSIFFNTKLCCWFSLESPHRGGSNEYTQYAIFKITKKTTPSYPKFVDVGYFPRDSKTSLKQPW